MNVIGILNAGAAVFSLSPALVFAGRKVTAAAPIFICSLTARITAVQVEVRSSALQPAATAFGGL